MTKVNSTIGPPICGALRRACPSYTFKPSNPSKTAASSESTLITTIQQKIDGTLQGRGHSLLARNSLMRNLEAACESLSFANPARHLELQIMFLEGALHLCNDTPIILEPVTDKDSPKTLPEHAEEWGVDLAVEIQSFAPGITLNFRTFIKQAILLYPYLVSTYESISSIQDALKPAISKYRSDSFVGARLFCEMIASLSHDSHKQFTYLLNTYSDKEVLLYMAMRSVINGEAESIHTIFPAIDKRMQEWNEMFENRDIEKITSWINEELDLDILEIIRLAEGYSVTTEVLLQLDTLIEIICEYNWKPKDAHTKDILENWGEARREIINWVYKTTIINMNKFINLIKKHPLCRELATNQRELVATLKRHKLGKRISQELFYDLATRTEPKTYEQVGRMIKRALSDRRQKELCGSFPEDQ